MIEILDRIQDAEWIVDCVLSIALNDAVVLDKVLLHTLRMLEHSETLQSARPNAFSQFIRYRERNRTLQQIMADDPEFDILQFLDLDDDEDDTQFDDDDGDEMRSDQNAEGIKYGNFKNCI